MSNDDILRAAVARADEHGFGLTDRLKKLHSQVINQTYDVFESGYYKAIAMEPHALIFAHDFAEAFFSADPCTCTPREDDYGNEYHKNDCKMTTPDWKCHLQSMVLEKDPIKYLGQFLNG